MRRAFWREYLRLFIFPLGGTTYFGRRLLEASCFVVPIDGANVTL
jgi:hypothetical protein